MMKKITLLCILLAVSFGYSQTEIAVNGDFESGDFTGWTQFENGTVQTINTTNPSEGTYCAQLNNNVPAVASVIKNANVGIGTAVGGQEATITLDARGTTAVGGVVFVKIISEIDGGGTSKDELFGPLALEPDPDTWKSFSFVSVLGNDVSGGVSLELTATTGGDAASEANIFFDNVKITLTDAAAPTCDDGIMNGDEEGIDCGGSCPDACPATEPTDAPPAPTADAADVISLFSDEYTDLAATWNPAWGQTTVVTDETIASNPVKKYSNFTFSGIEPTGGTIDATAAPAKTHINVDYWTSDATELKIKLVDYRGDGAWGGDNIEVEITKPVTTGAWGVVSIALSEFTEINPTMILSDIGQLVLSATGATNPVYIDNLYFVNSPTAGLDDFDSASFNVYPNPSNNVWNVKSNNTVINAIHVFDVLGKQVLSLQPKSNNVSIDANELTKGLYFAKIESDTGISSIKLIKN